jgi:hypothetical protein
MLAELAAQTEAAVDLDWIPSEKAPRSGNFFSLKYDWPPLPFNWLAEFTLPVLPLHLFGEGFYVVDDRSVDYDALKREREVARLQSDSLLSLEDPGTLDSLMMDHPEGSLWLEIQQSAPYADSFYLFLHGSESGVEYKILGQSALLAGNFTVDGSILGAASIPSTTVWRQGRDMAFFRAVRSDGDTDGDRLPDWWELRYGLNPFLAADAAGDLDGDGISNLAEYGSETDPTTPDALLAFVAEPKSAAHIP